MFKAEQIQDIARYGLENDQEKLVAALNELIEYSKQSKKINFALQLQSLIKDALRQQKTSSLTKVGSDSYFQKIDDREFGDFIIEKLTSEYTFANLICNADAHRELEYVVQEHRVMEKIRSLDLPITNKIVLHGPSGCGKTLASYVLAGELKKLMYVINLGSIVSSKLGETSRNLSKIFRRAAAEDCIIFMDEFDSLGKLRDYNQDHGEMKRVVNTLLQLFDYLPQTNILIAATNQKDMIDDALLRRFDVSIRFDLPEEAQIRKLVDLTLKNGKFQFDKPATAKKLIATCRGLSYYSIQKTLVTAIKRSIMPTLEKSIPLTATIDTSVWGTLIAQEKAALSVGQ